MPRLLAPPRPLLRSSCRGPVASSGARIIGWLTIAGLGVAGPSLEGFGVPAAAASVRELTGPGDDLPRDPWPQAEVERPLTLPGKATRLSAGVDHFRPKLRVNDPPFSPTTTAGAWAAHALTDQWQLSFAVPRIYCQAAHDPSGCDERNRWNGSSVGVSWAPFGPGEAQLALHGRLAVRGRDPALALGSLSAEGKLVPLSRLALEAWAGATYGFNADASTREVTDRVFASALVGVQAMKPLYLWSSGSLSTHATSLAAWDGGASWTFANHLEIDASASRLFVVGTEGGSSRPVVGWTYAASLSVLLD